MKIQHSEVFIGILIAVLSWPHWSIGCAIDGNCLPLRPQLADSSKRSVVVNRGGAVTITCNTDCKNMNFTGCNVTDDWVAIVTDASGNSIMYDSIKLTRKDFRQETGIESINFSRTISQEGICNGTLSEEQFSATFNIGDNPSFSTILLSCGLGRFGRAGYEPDIKAHDFKAVTRIDLNDSNEETTTNPLPVTTPNPEDGITVFSHDIDETPLLAFTTPNNASITCTKTSGSISELKVMLLDHNGRIVHDSRLLYTVADNRKLLKDMGIDIRETDSYIESGNVWQNFEVLLTNIQKNMLIRCGARASSGIEAVYYDHIIVTVSPQVNPVDPQGQKTIEQSTSISLGVILPLVLVLAVVCIILTVIVVTKLNRRGLQRRPQSLRSNGGLPLSDPYFKIVNHPIEILSERIATQERPSAQDLDNIRYSYS